ncbi:MAG: WYL domain-containing protein [Geobacteraceae bacterium]|nr:WYL domain-containing protein [Geobacteraceae bacterium]
MDTTYRQWLILRMIPRKRRISTSEICRRLLDEHGLEEQIRNIQRDLVSLERNFPLENDGKRPAGWKWQEDAPTFDIPNMDPVTALTFKLAEKYVGKMLPPGVLTALKPYALAADQRLKQTSASRLCVWSEKVRVVSRNLAQIPPSVPAMIYETTYAALLEERRFAARYRNLGGEVKDFEVSPLGMAFVEGMTYLVATINDYGNPVLLLLHRILDASLLDTPVSVPDDFSLDDYISRELSFPVGKDMKLAVLLSSRSAVQRLQESPIAIDQKIRELEDGRFELTATVVDSVHLRWWLREYGERVEVLRPKKLRNEFIDLAQELSEMYQPSG